MAFVLNPYYQTFNPAGRVHLKLYTNGCQGLNKGAKFDGERENYNNVVKLIKYIMVARRIKNNLRIETN